ncbi:MAG: molybdopterin-dependent oxidoreductase [Rhodospirillales bacterium]|nr:molybdopterin-dependent oxidoreductase [Rhodospirillales bacterium]
MAGVRTTCPYCGVGCGVVAQADGRIAGDRDHPANFGRLCSKGAALGRTLGHEGRLTTPRLHGTAIGWDAALDHAAARFAETIAAHGPDSVAFYVSGQFLTEDYYVANKLMKGFIGSANIDTNSRLCMASTVAGHVRAFGEDVVPGLYADWEQADLVVLVGSNTAWCHPVLYQRLVAARAERGTRIVVLDPRRTATSEAADLHLPLAADSDVALFNFLLAHLAAEGQLDQAWLARHASGAEAALAAAGPADLDATAAICGIDPEALLTFADWFARTGRVLTVFSQGVNQSAIGTDKVNAILNCHLATGRIGRPGMGPFSVTGQPNAMGGREVGGLANQLAAHMRFDDADQRAALRNFWRAPRLPARPGLKAVELFEAMLDGRVRAVWIAATNPAASMPRAGRVRAALEACPFVVAADCWETDTTRRAHLVLPAAGWGEKDGTVTNSERRISRQRRFRDPPGEARADWWMFAALGRRMGWADAFAWPNAAAVFREHAALSGTQNDGRRLFDISGLAGLSDEEFDRLAPTLWPAPAGTAGERLFAAGGFATPDGRARLVPTPWRGAPAGEGPTLLPNPAPLPNLTVLLNTGRVRDQWHTMTRTGRIAALLAHVAEPRIAVNPADAAAIGLAEEGLAQVQTAHGAIILRTELRHAQRRGEIFAPMHWSDDFLSEGPVARLVRAHADPHSGQPALKSTPARLAPVAAGLHGLLLTQAAIAVPPPWHWVRQTLEAGHAHRLAWLGRAPRADALADLAARLLPAGEGLEWLEMTDPARHVLRLAALRDGVLEACLFLAADPAAVPEIAVMAPSLGERVDRALLLAGRPASAADDEGPRICACFGVGLKAVRHAVVTERLASVAQIGARLRAGTNCGSCLPELAQVLRDLGAGGASDGDASAGPPPAAGVPALATSA